MPHAPQVARHVVALVATLGVLAVVELTVASIGLWMWLAGGAPIVAYAAERSYQSWRRRRNDKNHVSTILSLEGQDLSNLDLTEIKLFERDDMATLTCQHSNLRHAVLVRADLPRASFKQSDLSYANLSGANCEEAKFYRTRLFEATFDQAQASAARFEDADLRHSSFKAAKLLNARFDNADLRNASFADARLINARFDGADVRGADFTGSTLEPDALVDAICDSETNVPSDCDTGKIRSQPGLMSSLQDGLQSAAEFSARPIMFAAGWAFVVVAAAFMAGQVEPITYEIAAERLAPASDGSRSTAGAARARSSVEEPQSAAELVGERTEVAEASAADASSDADSSSAADSGLATADAPVPSASGAEAPSTENQASTQSTAQATSTAQPTSTPAATTTTQAPTTAATTQPAQPESTELPEPALTEVSEVAPPLLEGSTVPPTAAATAGVNLTIGSEGGASSASYSSDVGNGGPFVANDQTVPFSIEATTGIVTVSVTPDDAATVAFCAIDVGTGGRNENRGFPGQAVTCTLDLDDQAG